MSDKADKLIINRISNTLMNDYLLKIYEMNWNCKFNTTGEVNIQLDLTLERECEKMGLSILRMKVLDNLEPCNRGNRIKRGCSIILKPSITNPLIDVDFFTLLNIIQHCVLYDPARKRLNYGCEFIISVAKEGVISLKIISNPQVNALLMFKTLYQMDECAGYYRASKRDKNYEIIISLQHININEIVPIDYNQTVPIFINRTIQTSPDFDRMYTRVENTLKHDYFINRYEMKYVYVFNNTGIVNITTGCNIFRLCEKEEITILRLKIADNLKYCDRCISAKYGCNVILTPTNIKLYVNILFSYMLTAIQMCVLTDSNRIALKYGCDFIISKSYYDSSVVIDRNILSPETVKKINYRLRKYNSITPEQFEYLGRYNGNNIKENYGIFIYLKYNGFDEKVDNNNTLKVPVKIKTEVKVDWFKKALTNVKIKFYYIYNSVPTSRVINGLERVDKKSRDFALIQIFIELQDNNMRRDTGVLTKDGTWRSYELNIL
jgi:hypothetical protein